MQRASVQGENLHHRPQNWQIKYWPYDEVTLKRGSLGNSESRDYTNSSDQNKQDSGSEKHYLISAPWITLRIEVKEEDAPRIETMIKRFNSNDLGPSDLADIQWLFSSVSHYPLSYILSRNEISHSNA